MSEYQYYEWQTIDRLLTAAEQEAVNGLSSHIEDDDNGTLSGLVGLRTAILEGDYRCLYLAWLRAMSVQDPDEFGEVEEPPVPAGLRKLTPALQRLAQFFDIDANLIRSAAAASPDRAAGVTDAALRRAVSRLSREECGDFLFRLAQGEAGLGLALRHKLQSDLKSPVKPASGSRRTVAALFETAEQVKREEAERKAIEAEERRIADLKKLAKREDRDWKDVETLLQQRHASAYDQAVAQLQQLRDLADYQKKRVEFNRRVRQLRERHKSRLAFIERLVRAGLA
jgi:hypothetical protein